MNIRPIVSMCLGSLLALGCAGSTHTQPEPTAQTVAQPASVVFVSPPAASEQEDSSMVTDGDDERAVARPWQPGDAVPDAWLHPEDAVARAPYEFTVLMDTTKGPVTVHVVRSWAPHGADRFYNLVRMGYYTDIAFFRVIDGFMVQFGIHGVPEVNRAWKEAKIVDDPVVETNARGRVTFAMAGPNSRTVQVFINTKDNARLDSQAFAPFGEVVRGMDVVDSLYAGYGEGSPAGNGPGQLELQEKGNAYVHGSFPKMDFIRSMRVVR